MCVEGGLSKHGIWSCGPGGVYLGHISIIKNENIGSHVEGFTWGHVRDFLFRRERFQFYAQPCAPLRTTWRHPREHSRLLVDRVSELGFTRHVILHFFLMSCDKKTVWHLWENEVLETKLWKCITSL